MTAMAASIAQASRVLAATTKAVATARMAAAASAQTPANINMEKTARGAYFIGFLLRHGNRFPECGPVLPAAIG